MNPQDGYRRDKQIISLVTTLGALTTEQVRLLCFDGLKKASAIRKSQERLKRLCDTGRLRRVRHGQTYAYYLERPRHMDHILTVNWCYVYLAAMLTSWERLVWERPDYGFLRPDAIGIIENTVTKATRGWYVEADLSSNRFDNVRLYNRMYESNKYATEWWADGAKTFPAVLVITERAALVQAAIIRENTHGLRWDVRTLDDVRGEIHAKRFPDASGGAAGDVGSGLYVQDLSDGTGQEGIGRPGETPDTAPMRHVPGSGVHRRDRGDYRIL